MTSSWLPAQAAPEAGEERFVQQVLSNRFNAAILDRMPGFELPDAWLVAGCLFQTAWNLRTGQPAAAQIRDYDLFYFDPSDISEATEREVQGRLAALCADLPVVIEAKNQARVHLWYEDWFGHHYGALRSSRDGIDRFLVACTCVGLRAPTQGAAPELYAPHGLADLQAGLLRPNPKCDLPELFAAKADSYISRWPWLRVA